MPYVSVGEQPEYVAPETVTVPPYLQMPPPFSVAVQSVNVTLLTESVPSLIDSPPPLFAVQFAIEPLVIVSVPP